MTRSEFDQLVSDLTAAASSYYDGAVTLMADAEYDAGIAQVEQLLEANPQWANDDTDGLLGKVAGGQSGGGDIVHPVRMLSMDKVTAGDADAWDAIAALIAKCRNGVTVEPKMDGLALRVEYRDGVLVLAVTRGDGFAGEDVTEQVTRGTGVEGLPRRLKTNWTGEVRGEIYMTADQFLIAQELRAERGGKPFVNPRNATAGALRKTGADNWMPLSFAAYDLTSDDDTATAAGQGTHTGRMATAGTLGFTTTAGLLAELVGFNSVITGLSGARATIDAIELRRPDLGFDIDGAVIKADHDADRATLGEGSRTPKWALAYKYPAEEATAIVEDFEVSIGRTGRLGLRARITPTFIAGTTVEFATCHNAPWLVSQGIGVGSVVMLKRAGDVIPRITAPLDTTANDGIEPWTPPAVCPQCGEPWNKDSLLWRCETVSCGLVNAVDYLASREALDVEGVGGVVAAALTEHEYVTALSDLYDLTADKLAELPLGTTSTGGVRRLGAANAGKIIAQLEASKSQPFNRVLTALGIRGTGRSLCRSLAREFPTMEKLRAATAEDLAGVEKIGPIKAKLIVDQLQRLAPTIDALAAHGVNMGSEPVADDTPKPLAGKTVVISGAVPAGYGNRTQAQEAIEALGGKASGSVSKNTSYLVTDETTTSKAKKAAELGVPVIDPRDFDKLLRGEL